MELNGNSCTFFLHISCFYFLTFTTFDISPYRFFLYYEQEEKKKNTNIVKLTILGCPAADGPPRGNSALLEIHLFDNSIVMHSSI